MRARSHQLMGMVLGLLFVATPVLATDLNDDATGGSFRALEGLMTQNHQPLKSFSDDQLASIEGEGLCFTCRSLHVQINVSPVIQIALINQFNVAVGTHIYQSNNAFGGNAVKFARHYRYQY